MQMGTKTLTLFGFLASMYIIGLVVFTKGFLLARTMVHQNSSCQVEFASRADDLVHGGHSGCWSHARFKKAIIVIIDALRYDFLAYDTSFKSDVPHYRNKLKTVHQLLNKYPQNTRLYKFMADPPTTTLQRLKGLTTGSLPTFVDAGANFDSSEITEDNWIDQLVTQGKDIKFLGDDTWESLFPNRFYKSFPFPSFNVKDLHTVDNGILKHLYSQIRRKDWDVVIAHFLGVDHCGHRFGPNHLAMGEKLQQMDQVIRNITQLMKEDTVLMVFGDHGMTRSGDHGGDSADELTAGLFIYSPAHITASTPKPQDKERVIQQTDLVPTLSLLLGLPIPFSNLGSVIPDLFNHCPWWDTQHNNIRQVFHTVKALHLNARQVSQYLTTYATVSSDLPAHTFHQLQMTLTQAESELQALVTGVTSGSSGPGLLDGLLHLSDKYQDYLSKARAMCQDVWAKFDLSAMTMGIAMVMGTLLINLVLVSCWEGEDLPGYVAFMVGGMVLQVVYYVIHVLLFPPSVMPLMGYVVGVVVIFSVGVVLKSQLVVLRMLTKAQIVDLVVVVCALFFSFATFFSNSFVVYEDSVTHFLAQTLLWYTATRVVLTSCKTIHQSGTDNIIRSKKSKQPSFVDIVELLTQPSVMIFVVTLVCSLLLRFSAYFRACREEQWTCEMPSFLQSLASFTEDTTGYRNQRYFFSVACVFVTVWLSRRWLQHYGNLNGDGLNVLCVKFVSPLTAIACALYWAVQALPQKELDALPAWQQTLMAQIVYVCVIVHLIINLIQPLYVYIHHSSPSNKVSMPLGSRGAEHTVPYVYRQLQQHWRNKDEGENPPSAYGLGSVYSSHLAAMVTALYLVLALLLGDGLSPSLALAVWIVFLFLELSAVYCNENTNSAEVHQPVPWLMVVTHGMLSSVFFYATGHQATIPTIRFDSAFTGFHGDFSNNIIPALLITLNTYAGPVLFAAVSPLMIMWRYLQGPVSRWMGGGGRQKEEWKGDFELFDDGLMLRKNVFVSTCRLLFFHAVKVFGAACAAGLHRRHLMVWKIFAPRFIFEAVNFIVVSAILLVVTAIVLRIDRRLNKLTHSLQKLS